MKIASGIVFLAAAAALGQNSGVSVRLDRPGGILYAKIGGTDKKVADSAQKAWVISEGRTVAYSAADGAGGNDNEGQSLYLYDIQTGQNRKVMAEYFMVDEVREARTSTGKQALLALMSDTSLDAYHVAVIDPGRGEVFCEDGAKIGSVDGDKLVLAYYGDDDWDLLRDNQEVKPQKTEEFDLKALLGRDVMTNQRH